MITKGIKVYLHGGGFPVVIPVSQFDTMWQFVFTIYNGSTIWSIPSNATAILNGVKPDGNVFAFSGDISANTVTINCDTQMTACAGGVAGSIVIQPGTAYIRFYYGFSSGDYILTIPDIDNNVSVKIGPSE